MYTLLLILIYVAFVSLGLPDSLLGAGWPVMHSDLQVPAHFTIPPPPLADMAAVIPALCAILSVYFVERKLHLPLQILLFLQKAMLFPLQQRIPAEAVKPLIWNNGNPPCFLKWNCCTKY